MACAPSAEAILRFFNFETRGNYTVPLHSQPGDTGADDGPAGPGSRRLEVTSLAYHCSENMLAVGLSSGRVQLLRHVHEDRCVVCMVSTTVLTLPRWFARSEAAALPFRIGSSVCKMRGSPTTQHR